jgi:hypothetical protein
MCFAYYLHIVTQDAITGFVSLLTAPVKAAVAEQSLPTLLFALVVALGAAKVLAAALCVAGGLLSTLTPGKNLKKFGPWAVVTGASDGIGLGALPVTWLVSGTPPPLPSPPLLQTPCPQRACCPGASVACRPPCGTPVAVCVRVWCVWCVYVVRCVCMSVGGVSVFC